MIPALSQISRHLQPLQGMLEIFLESTCPLCESTSPAGICASCQRQIQRCCLSYPNWDNTDSLPVLAWGSYQGQLRQAIGTLKYKQQPEIARFLGSQMGQLWSPPVASRPSAHLAVIPIPLHPQRLAERGFNQAELISRWFCQQTGLRHCPAGLMRQRATTAQHRLSASQRQQNLEGAFAIGKGITRQIRSVLLIDDIYTTGATARAAATVLEKQGITVIGIGVVARAVPAVGLPPKSASLPRATPPAQAFP